MKNGYDFLRDLNLKKGSVVFHVGAYGDTTRIIRNNVGEDCQIYCFDGDVENVKRKEKEIGDIANIIISYPSDTEDKITFYDIKSESNGDLYLSSFKKPRFLANYYHDLEIREGVTDVIIMDNYSSKFDVINFIWCDVNGTENNFLMGSKETLKKTEYVLIKFSNNGLYHGQEDLEKIKELLGKNFRRLDLYDMSEYVLFENINLHQKGIAETGYWKTQNLNEHAFDLSLSNYIGKYLKNKGYKDLLDLGCGPGKYVDNLISIHDINAYGLDGNPHTKELSNGLCGVQDLTIDFYLGKKYDAVICLEVGEHIPEKYAGVLIENITKHSSDVVIISWGIPGQGGYGHVNCQENIYVEKLMNNKGFKRIKREEIDLRESSTFDWFKETLMLFKKND